MPASVLTYQKKEFLTVEAVATNAKWGLRC